MNLLVRLAALSLALSAPALAAELVLTAIDGTQHTPLVAKDGKPALLFFVSPFCSTTKAFVTELNQITADHGSKMTVYIVQCDPEVTRDVAIEHATISGFKAPVLMDTAQELTKGVQATITPESVLLTPAGEVYYRGRINDLYLGPTKRQRAATTSDLRDAIASLLAGKPAPEAQEPAQGCKISGLK